MKYQKLLFNLYLYLSSLKSRGKLQTRWYEGQNQTPKNGLYLHFPNKRDKTESNNPTAEFVIVPQSICQLILIKQMSSHLNSLINGNKLCPFPRRPLISNPEKSGLNLLHILILIELSRTTNSTSEPSSQLNMNIYHIYFYSVRVIGRSHIQTHKICWHLERQTNNFSLTI